MGIFENKCSPLVYFIYLLLFLLFFFLNSLHWGRCKAPRWWAGLQGTCGNLPSQWMGNSL